MIRQHFVLSSLHTNTLTSECSNRAFLSSLNNYCFLQIEVTFLRGNTYQVNKSSYSLWTRMIIEFVHSLYEASQPKWPQSQHIYALNLSQMCESTERGGCGWRRCSKMGKYRWKERKSEAVGGGECSGVSEEGKEAVTASSGEAGGQRWERWGSVLSGWWDHREWQNY